MPNIDWTNKNTLQNLINTVHARLVKKITHYTVMPTATVDLLGEISQYIGDTDTDYTNAYFYKCVSEIDEDTGDTIYKWIPVEIQNSTHISEKGDNSIVELSDGIYSRTVQIEQLPEPTEDNEGIIYQYIGDTTGLLLTGHFYRNYKLTDPDTGVVSYNWKEIDVQSVHVANYPDNAIEVYIDDGLYVKATQIETMPEATEYYANKIYQFMGDTDDTYTNGYFYKCVEGENGYEWTEIQVQENDPEHIDLTMDEYEALPDSKYTDDKVYFIVDGEDIEPEIVYGFSVDPDESDPYEKITYLKSAIGMTPAGMGATTFNYGSWKNAFFMPKPCMLKSNGTVDYYLNPNDYSKKIDGTPSDIGNTSYDGNAMMEWGLIWFKFEAGTVDGEWSFYVANKQVDSTYDCPCNKDVNGDIIPHFYTAIYNGTGTTKLRSLSGVALNDDSGCGNTTGFEELERAVANNTTSDIEWYVDVWCDRMLINALHFLISHSLDSQSKFGMGLVGNNEMSSSSELKDLKDQYVSGSLNNRGLFFGKLSNGDMGVKTFGMENWWGTAWRRIAGFMPTANGYLYKMTAPYNHAGTGYTEIVVSKPTVGWITKMMVGDFGCIPVATGGSSSTYYSDHYRSDSQANCAICGAITVYNAGCSALGVYGLFGSSDWSVSTTLSCKPLASRF